MKCASNKIESRWVVYQIVKKIVIAIYFQKKLTKILWIKIVYFYEQNIFEFALFVTLYPLDP